MSIEIKRCTICNGTDEIIDIEGELKHRICHYCIMVTTKKLPEEITSNWVEIKNKIRRLPIQIEEKRATKMQGTVKFCLVKYDNGDVKEIIICPECDKEFSCISEYVDHLKADHSYLKANNYQYVGKIRITGNSVIR